MAKIPYPAFFGGHYEPQSPTALNRAVWNFFLEKNEAPGAEFPLWYRPTPGWQAFANPAGNLTTLAIDIVRSSTAERLFVVDNDQLYEVSLSTGTFTARGAITGASEATVASLAWNGDGGDELLIAPFARGAPGEIWHYDLATNTLTDITSTSGEGNRVDSLDGFFIMLNVVTSTISASALLDGTTWPVGAFAQRAAAPDPWRSMLVHDGFIWLFGSETSERWYNAGTSPFPFAVDKSSIIPFGIAGVDTAAAVGGLVIWATMTGGIHVVASGGSGVERISDHSLERWLAELVASSGATILGNLTGRGFFWAGQWFYLLTVIAGANPPIGSWLYSLATRTWTRVGTWNTGTAAFDGWSPLFPVFSVTSGLIFGDCRVDTLWRAVEPTQGDDTAANGLLDTDGLAVRRVIRPPVIRALNDRLFVPRLELLVESGLGEDGVTDDPVVALQYRANGKTWVDGGERGVGEEDTFTRTYWTRLGSGRQWQPEFIFEDAIPWRVCGCYVNIEPGTEARGR